MRRYLKPPLRDSKVYAEEQEKDHSKSKRRDRSNLAIRRDSTPLELPTERLLRWRRAVKDAMSASQLALCMCELERCIAWEKSSTIVFCQSCHSGENENLLLLCDGCDKGTHTYCCKPELSSIPEGDWYCHDCVRKNTKYRPCHVCGNQRGILLSCTICPKQFHKRCLNPPLAKLPTGVWKCPTCKHKPIPRPRVNKDSSAHSGSGGTPRKRGVPKDPMAVCRMVLKALEKQEEAWPFLVAVDKRKFREYYQVIKNPMDFATIKGKIKDGKYANKDQFANDVRLVFANCEVYNEDESDIGMAGHSMKMFFEKKWAEVNR